jgi:uncharacterized protein YjbJ (UPF0337 family)
MVWDWLTGNWKQLIGPMQEKWGKLTYNDVVATAGDRERLVGLLQERYGYQRMRAETELNEFARTQNALGETQVEDCSPSLKP